MWRLSFGVLFIALGYLSPEVPGCQDANSQPTTDRQIELLCNGTDREKMDAAEYLGERKVQSAVEPLIRGLPCAPEAVQCAFVDALARIGSRRAVLPVVAELVRSEQEPRTGFQLLAKAPHLPSTCRRALRGLVGWDFADDYDLIGMWITEVREADYIEKAPRTRRN